MSRHFATAEHALACIAAVTAPDTDVGRYARNYFRKQAKVPPLQPVETSASRFTPEQLRFIRNEMNASLSCGATDPLFQSVYDRAKEMLRSPVEPSAPQDESGWLIELAMKGVPHWLMVSSVREWTPDAIKAVRFAREEDAEAMLFFLGIEDSKATEHAWVATSPRECGPPADHCEKHGPHRAFAGGCPGCYHEKHDLPRAQEKAKAPLCNCAEGVCHGQAVAQIYGHACRTESK